MHVVKRLRKGNTWSTNQKRTRNYPWLHLIRQTVAQEFTRANPKIPPSNIYDNETIHQEEQKGRDLLCGEPDLMNPSGYERLTTVLRNTELDQVRSLYRTEV